MNLEDIDPRQKNIIIEKNAINKIKKLCDRLNMGNKVLLIYGNIIKKIAGDKIQSILEPDYKVETFISTASNLENVLKAKDQIMYDNICIVIGIGGGRPIDVAKLSSYQASIPFISVPTAASHDGIASSRSTIEFRKGKASVKAHPPVAVLADTDILSKSPKMNYKAGLADLISNLTAVYDWKLSGKFNGDEFNPKIADLSLSCAIEIIDNGIGMDKDIVFTGFYKDIIKPIAQGYDIALGSRFLNKKTNIPFSRKLVLKGGTFICRLFYGIKLTDTHNGFRALSKEAAKKIRITEDKMEHASQIIDEIAKHKLKYKEVPVTIKYSEYSLNKGQSIFNAVKILSKMFVNKFLK